MNHRILFCIAVMLVSFGSITAYQEPPGKELRSNLIGEWIYHYSLIEKRKDTVDFNLHCPTFKMVFSACNDGKELAKMPKVVKDLRKDNVLKNICYQAYQHDLKLIDRYFPVADRVLSGSVEVYNYGKKLKSDYFIDKVNADTLIVHDNKVYKIYGKQYFPVQHVYVKKKQ